MADAIDVRVRRLTLALFLSPTIILVGNPDAENKEALTIGSSFSVS